MKVLITGGSGFVGSELQSYLRYRHDIQAASADIMDAISFNVCDEDELRRTLRHYDTIIHLAAIVGEPACIVDPELSYNVNVGAVRKIVRNLSLSQRFIFMSTSSVYGNRPGELVDEATTPLPNNNYARQKYEAEQIIQDNLRNYIIFRPVTAFGVSQQIRLDLLVNTFIYEALTTGQIQLYEPNIIRPMIHVTDFARMIIHALDNNMRWGEIYNIGDPSMTMTKSQLARRIAKLCNALVIPVEGSSLDLRDYNISFKRLEIPKSGSNSYIIWNSEDFEQPYLTWPFEFTKNPLELAVNQIILRLPQLMKNPDEYSTVERTKQLFKEYGDVLV